MKSTLTLGLLLLFVAGIALSCAKSGRATLQVYWPILPEQPLWLTVSVQEQVDDSDTRVLVSTVATKYTPGESLRLDLNGVPNGNERVAVVEARTDGNDESRVLYYGISEPFILEPGADTVTKVPILMQLPEADVEPPDAQVILDGESTSMVGISGFAQLALRTRSKDAVAIRVANDEDFVVDVHSFDIDDEWCDHDAGEIRPDRCEFPWLFVAQELVQSPEKWAPGTYSAYLRFVDRNGYESQTVVAKIMLDRSPPAIASATLSPPVVGPGMPFVLSVTFTESLNESADHEMAAFGAGDTIVNLSPPAFPAGGTIAVWTGVLDTAEGPPAGPISFQVRPVDNAGDRTPAPIPVVNAQGIPVLLTYDQTPPSVAAMQLLVEPDYGVNGDSGILVGHNSSIHLEVVVQDESELAPGFPKAHIESPTPLAIPINTIKDPQTYSYLLILDANSPIHRLAEGSWSIVVTARDVAGNESTTTYQPGDSAAPLVLDFSPPQANCSLLPPPLPAYGLSHIPVLEITPTEPLAQQSGIIVVDESISGTASPLWHFDGAQGDQTLRFVGQVVPEMGEQVVTTRVVLADRLGNTTPKDRSACNDGEPYALAVDGMPPEIELLSTQVEGGIAGPSGTIVAGPGDTVNGTIRVAGSSQSPQVKVGGQLALASLQTNETQGATWTFERLLDGSESQGPLQVALSVYDEAGNLGLANASVETVAVDFNAPSANCMVSLPIAKGGDHIEVQVSFSELVSEPKVVFWPPLPFLPVPEKTMTEGPQPVYVFALDIPLEGLPDTPETTWSFWATATDLAGNVATGPCTGGGLIDAQPITILEASLEAGYYDPLAPAKWVDSGQIIGPTSLLKATVQLSEMPATNSAPLLHFGSVPVVLDCIPPGLCLTAHSYTPAMHDNSPYVDVAISVTDKGGNATMEPLGTLLVDTLPPQLATTPIIQRCDAFAAASNIQNDLWVNDLGHCEFPSLNCTDDTIAGAVRITVQTNEHLYLPGCQLHIEPEGIEATTCGDGNTLKGQLAHADMALLAPGVHPVSVTLRDKAGNASQTIEVGTLHMDRTPPDAPDTESLDGLVIHRAPWGLAQTPKAPGVTLSASPGTFEKAALIQVFDNADPAAATLIGQGTAAADGSLGLGVEGPLFLQPFDASHVYVTATDRAGNVSGTTPGHQTGYGRLVTNGDWTASFGNKFGLDLLANPHRSFIVTALSPAYNPATQHESPDGAALADEGLGLDSNGGGYWRQRVLVAPPLPSLVHSAMTAAPTDSSFLLLGGLTNGEADGSLRTLAHDLWYDILPSDDCPEGVPGPRSGHSLTTDPSRDVVVLYGGRNKGQLLSDLWEWDGRRWRLAWEAEAPYGPGPRADAAAVYHPGLHRILIMGGLTADGPSNETWSWDGERFERLESDVEPPARFDHALTWWEEAGGVLLVGGRSQDATLGDAWLLSAEQWAPIPALYTQPRFGHLLLAPADGLGPMLVGGISGNTPLGDVARASDNGWEPATLSTESGSALPPGAHRAAACNALPDSCMIFGGVEEAGASSNTWRLNGGFLELVPTPLEDEFTSPGVRARSAAVLDVARSRTVLFGGQTYGNLPLAGTWEWDGSLWQQRQLSGPGPDHRYDHAMVYDPDRGVTCLFGGLGATGAQGDTWEWDGNDWSLLLPTDAKANDRPTPRHGAAAAWDGNLSEVTLFGGRENSIYGDTWSWDGSSWQHHLTDTSPSPRVQAQMAWDTPRQEVVLFGGHDPQSDTLLGDTWSWNGSQWKMLQSDADCDSCPAPRKGHALLYDPGLQRVLLMGGIGESGHLNDVWQWDGATWQQVSFSDADGPGPRAHAVLFTDPATDQPTLYGGDESGEFFADQWYWLQGHSQPAHRVRFDASTLLTDPLVSPLTVEVNWSATGTEFPTGGTVHGTSLLGWQRGAWLASDSGIKSSLSWTLSGLGTDGFGSSGPLGPSTPYIDAAITTQGMPGIDVGSLHSNWVEAKVSYRLGAAVRWRFGSDWGTGGWRPKDGLQTVLLEEGGIQLQAGTEGSTFRSPPLNIPTDALPLLQLTGRTAQDVAVTVVLTGKQGTTGVTITVPPSNNPITLRQEWPLTLPPDGQPYRIELSLPANASFVLHSLGLSGM